MKVSHQSQIGDPRSHNYINKETQKKRGFVINYENPKLSENINNPKYDKGIYYLRTVANSRFNPRN